MAQLLGLKIRNYKSLADVSLGQVAYNQGDPLPALSCFIGPNGSGKSTLLDAFGFMADCLREGVEAACDKPQRGGFSRVKTQGSKSSIRFELYYRQTQESRPITYIFAIDEENGVPVVVEERLSQFRQKAEGTKKGGKSYDFLRLKVGKGQVWAGEATAFEESARRAPVVTLEDRGRLGIMTFGQLKEHHRIVGLRSYIESWYLSYFIPDAARTLPPAGAQKHLDRTGENLANVVQYLERSDPKRFSEVLDRMTKKIPGIKKIQAQRSPDGRLLLRFNEQGYQDPFYQQSMSDGTLKLFAYLILLEDPEPRPFIGIEEPENGLYHKLIESLAREFLRHAEDSLGTTQLLVTTHSPYFVDALQPEQVWLMEKNEKGHTEVRRTSEIAAVRELVKEEIPLGSVWYSNHFDERFPR